MSSINHRLKFFPQLEFYDAKVNTRILPFAVLAGPKNLRSQTVNTDNNGFRHSILEKIIYAVDKIEGYTETTLFLGGSTTFGVGASSDAMTVASQYARISGDVCLNLGVRGAVSVQELLHLFNTLPKANKVKKIIVLSGVNDLYVNFSQKIASELDARFEQMGSEHLAYPPIRHFTTKILSKLYGVNSSKLLPLSKKELLTFPFIKHVVEKPLTDFERFEKVRHLQKRNFMIYSALQKQLNCKILFVLQPFFPWTQKQASEKEALVFRQLEMMQTFSEFTRVKKIIGQSSIYKEYVTILEDLSDEFDVNFYNLNPKFTGLETLFCDQIHLTDSGNMLAAELMHKHLMR